ncbi:hypothetical protein NW754_002127 [Fusarium falciforme]|nr:hypothetical protein NW754_002127 [Fusarium falciforme]KAJ4187083.1 hypothetical protein NW767_012415 [Fusarium falciforme]KAJ4260331.1 hypothetical protein NW757_002283 [Fusarium falciforme]
MDQANRRQKPSKAGERVFKTKTCNIPSLTELRKSLGYGHRGEERDIAFKRALTAQVETFVSKDNLPGVSFTKWKTPAHQKGLREITKDFLVIKQKGPEFWPDDPNSSNKRPLEYTRDYDQIHRLLTKVFYRTARERKRKHTTTSTPKESAQNPKSASTKQPHSNKNSSEQTSREAYPDSRGQSADDPIELDNMQSTTNAPASSEDVAPFVGTSLRFTFVLPAERMPDGIPPTDKPIDEPNEQGREMQDDYLDFQAPRDGNSTSSVPFHPTPEDPFQVPNSPAQDTHIPQDRGKRPLQQYPIQDVRPAKVPRKEQDNAEAVEGPSTSGSSSSFAPTSFPSQDAPPTETPSAAPVKERDGTHHESKQTRFSNRLRRPVVRPEYAREQTTDEAIFASAVEDGEGQDNDGDRRFREAPRPAVNASNDTSCRENPSGAEPRGNATAPAAEQPPSKSRQKASKKQASTKKISKPRAPASKPGSSARRGPVQESPAGPSTERNSAQQQANSSSTSGAGTRQPPTNHSQTSQPHTNEPQTEQNRPPPDNNVPSAEERQIIDASSFRFYRHNGKEYKSWRPSANVFQMTLAELMQDLGWAGNNIQPLYMRLDCRPHDEPYAGDVEPSDNAEFNAMKDSFVKKMQGCYELTGEPKLNFELHFRQQKV